MEGVDITMVWNTLLLLLQYGFKCADKFLFADWWREAWGLMRFLFADSSTGRTDGDWNHCGCLAAGGRAHSDAMMQPGVCDAGDVRGGGLGCT